MEEQLETDKKDRLQLASFPVGDVPEMNSINAQLGRLRSSNERHSVALLSVTWYLCSQSRGVLLDDGARSSLIGRAAGM